MLSVAYLYSGDLTVSRCPVGFVIVVGPECRPAAPVTWRHVRDTRVERYGDGCDRPYRSCISRTSWDAWSCGMPCSSDKLLRLLLGTNDKNHIFDLNKHRRIFVVFVFPRYFVKEDCFCYWCRLKSQNIRFREKDGSDEHINYALWDLIDWFKCGEA